MCLASVTRESFVQPLVKLAPDGRLAERLIVARSFDEDDSFLAPQRGEHASRVLGRRVAIGSAVYHEHGNMNRLRRLDGADVSDPESAFGLGDHKRLLDDE